MAQQAFGQLGFQGKLGDQVTEGDRLSWQVLRMLLAPFPWALA